MKEEAGRKDRLRRQLATISAGIKRNKKKKHSLRVLHVAAARALVPCHTLHLLELSHYQAKRNWLESKNASGGLWNKGEEKYFLLGLTVGENSKHLVMIKTRAQWKSTAIVGIQTEFSGKEGVFWGEFGLTKALLAEGDAPFPFYFLFWIRQSLRRTLLLRKATPLAQRAGENSRKKQQSQSGGELTISRRPAPTSVNGADRFERVAVAFHRGVVPSVTCSGVSPALWRWRAACARFFCALCFPAKKTLWNRPKRNLAVLAGAAGAVGKAASPLGQPLKRDSN